MELGAYLKKHGISQEKFAASLDPPVSQGLIWQLLNDKTPYTLDITKRIVKGTAGEVTPNDCMPDTFPRGFKFPKVAA